MFPTDERDGSGRDAASVPAGLVLAGIGRRVGGFAIDQVLVLVPVAIGVAAFGFRSGDDVSTTGVLVLNGAVAVSRLIYETLLVGFFGRTVGKIATGTRVVRQTDGGRIGWFAAVQRALVPVLFSGVPRFAIFYDAFVYMFAFLGPLRQGLHDRVAGTLVVLNGPRPVTR
ncbi:MAG: hypothetical protein JWN99_3094 [Ilumatobacteraceae bacterium]|nr:hypothetical protein [Ilumatobacteraceae bacterium]